jgi:hypothetical protein
VTVIRQQNTHIRDPDEERLLQHRLQQNHQPTTKRSTQSWTVNPVLNKNYPKKKLRTNSSLRFRVELNEKNSNGKNKEIQASWWTMKSKLPAPVSWTSFGRTFRYFSKNFFTVTSYSDTLRRRVVAYNSTQLTRWETVCSFNYNTIFVILFLYDNVVYSIQCVWCMCASLETDTQTGSEKASRAS